MKRHWPLLIVVLLAVAGLRRQASLGLHRDEHRRLASQLESLVVPPPPATSPRGPSEAMDPAAVQALREEAFRVYGLRSEVTKAQQEHDSLVDSVGKLSRQLDAKTNLAPSNTPASFPPGYLPRHQLADRGNATPEAAVETYWWAFTEGNVGKLQTLILEAAGQPAPPKDAVADDMKSIFQQFPGYRIVSRDIAPGNRVKVGLEAGPGGKTFHLMLVATNNQWMISMKDSDQF